MVVIEIGTEHFFLRISQTGDSCKSLERSKKVSKIDTYTLMVKQHDMIKEAIEETKKVMDLVRTQGSATDYLDLVDKLEKVKYLLLEHGEFEEDELVPLLKKLYNGQEELANYVADEHVTLEKELNVLIRMVKEHVGDNREKLDQDLYYRMNKYLHQTVTHLVEEEISLFPMLKMMLSSQG